MTATRTDWLRYSPKGATSARAETPLFPFLSKLIHGVDLTSTEAATFLKELCQSGSIQISAALAALTAKGETSHELAGMASAMRQLAVKVRSPKNAIDIAGTGSSPARTFNISTAAAIVAAGAGLTIAKQSNRGHTSATGSTDVLAELGIKPVAEPAQAQLSLNTGMCFLSAPKFHPELRRVADVRSRLGIRTCLNILGLLASPASVRRHVIGVWHRSLVLPVASALAELKAESAWVVHGEDGLDEITLSGRTHVASIEGGNYRSYVLSPKDFGLKASPIDHLRVTTPKESAAIIREVLSSRRRDEARSLVVMNAAAALIVGGMAKEPLHAARMAEQSIDSGQAQNKLDRLIQVMNRRTAGT